MDTKIKNTILIALRNRAGDDLQRAKAAFRNYTSEQMNNPYGASLKTPNQILAEYQRHNDECLAAIDWINKQ